MLDLDTLSKIVIEKMGNSRELESTTINNALINSANDLISEFKQNVLIVNYKTSEDKKVIKIPNIAYIYEARFDNITLPLYRLAQCSHDSKTKLIVLDSQSVRLEPFKVGELEILGSFFISKDAKEIPLSPMYQRALLQGATLDLFILLDKPLEHIKSAKMILNELKDELRSQINRASEKNAISTKPIRI